MSSIYKSKYLALEKHSRDFLLKRITKYSYPLVCSCLFLFFGGVLKELDNLILTNNFRV